MQTYTQWPAPPHPQSTMAKSHVSVGINRSAQSSSHPALKSFPEVVLQKPAAEEDKREAIPQAQRLLSSTQLSLCYPLLLLHSSLIPTFLLSLHYFYPPSFPQHLMLSVPLSVPSFPLALHPHPSSSSSIPPPLLQSSPSLKKKKIPTQVPEKL